jgi:hypothetical protein
MGMQINAGYQWMTMSTVTNSTAEGSIVGGTGFNDVSVSITHTGGGMDNHSGAVGSGEFPLTIGGVNVNIPTVANQIKNLQAGTFTATFDKPVTNILVAFASVGQSNLIVPVTVSAPFTPLWTKEGYTVYSDPVGANQYRQFTGEEGYNLIRIDGTMTEISFIYGASENYCTMSFGFVDQNDPDLDRGCNPIFNKFAYLEEDGCVRFKRLRHLGFL